MKHFTAPWGTTLTVMSALASVLCLGLTVFLWQSPTPADLGQGSFWLNLIPVALVIGCALFCIRGYALTPDTLIIQRLFWQTRIPLAGLQSAEFLPRAMRWSIRTCGNGGFFSFSGFYWNRGLRSYRAFVTDLDRTVVLRFATRTILVSPGSAEEFVQELSSNHGKI